MPSHRSFKQKIGHYLFGTRSIGIISIALFAMLHLGSIPANADIPTNSSVIHIEGNGWGHGVGMSQYGAYGRALTTEEGGGAQTAAAILAFYYPGTNLTVVEMPNDLRVHLFSGEGATFTTSGPVDLLDASGNPFVNIPAATVLTVSRTANAISVTTPDNIDQCIEVAQPENIQHCSTGAISITLVEGEPIQTEVVDQFTNIGTSGNSYQWGTLTIRERFRRRWGLRTSRESTYGKIYLWTRRGLAQLGQLQLSNRKQSLEGHTP